LQCDEPVFIMELRAAENIDHVYIRSLQGRQSIAAAFQKTEPAACCGRTLRIDIADCSQNDGAPVTQSGKRRQVSVQGGRAGADYQCARSGRH